MKQFLIKIGVGAVVAFIVALLLDMLISYGLYTTQSHPHQAWREIRSGQYASDIVILGTSRALEHYDPYVIDSITGLTSYNLGMGGYRINVQLMKYHYYLHYNPQPRYIIYDVDQLLLQIDSVAHQHQSEQFLPLFYDIAIRDELMHVGYSLIDAYVPMARYWGYQTHNKRGIVEALNIKHYRDYSSYRGYSPDSGFWEPSRLHIVDSIKPRIDKEAKQMFESFVDECEKSGVELIFVTSPVYYTYVEMSPSWDIYISYFDSVAHANNISYLNYMNHSICQDSTMFNAGVHLTLDGAKSWSVMLSNDLMIANLLKYDKNETVHSNN